MRETMLVSFQLRIAIGISTKTLAKISAHEQISMEVLEKICGYLKVQPGEIFEYIEENTVETK